MLWWTKPGPQEGHHQIAALAGSPAAISAIDSAGQHGGANIRPAPGGVGDHAIDELGQGGHVVDSLLGNCHGRCRPGGSTARQNCDESRPLQVGKAAYRANKRWARSTSAPRQTARPKATSVPVCLGVMPRCRCLSLTTILPDRRPTRSQFARSGGDLAGQQPQSRRVVLGWCRGTGQAT